MKKALKWIGAILLLFLIIATSIYLIYLRPFMHKMSQTSTLHFDKDLTLILGGGGNSGILDSDSLVIVIDTKMDEAAEELHKTVQQIAGTKPILVINTHVHPDHSKGNVHYKGQQIMAGGNYSPEFWIREAGKETMPTQWLKDRLDIRMGNDTVTILNLAKQIHTTSDVVVYLHRRKMLFAGDVILNKQAPVLLGDADPEGYLASFDWLQNHFPILLVVPGHGDVGGPELIDTFRQYFKDMKLAASDPSKEDALLAKYKDWNQLPIVMSPGATVRAFKKNMAK